MGETEKLTRHTTRFMVEVDTPEPLEDVTARDFAVDRHGCKRVVWPVRQRAAIGPFGAGDG